MQHHCSVEPHSDTFIHTRVVRGRWGGGDLVGLWCTKVPNKTQSGSALPPNRKRPNPKFSTVGSVGNSGQKAATLLGKAGRKWQGRGQEQNNNNIASDPGKVDSVYMIDWGARKCTEALGNCPVGPPSSSPARSSRSGV